MKRTNWLAIAACVAACLGLGVSVFLHFLSRSGLSALVAGCLLGAGAAMGIAALVVISRHPQKLKGRGYAILAIVVAYLCLALEGHWAQCGIGARALAIEGWISSYIQANQGRFPSTEDDLQKDGYLRRTGTVDETEYAIRYARDSGNWQPLSHFASFKIAYGASVEALELKGVKLHNRSTHEELLLIDGPYSWCLRRSHYRPISVRWYTLMRRAKQETRESSEIPSHSEP